MKGNNFWLLNLFCFRADVWKWRPQLYSVPWNQVCSFLTPLSSEALSSYLLPLLPRKITFHSWLHWSPSNSTLQLCVAKLPSVSHFQASFHHHINRLLFALRNNVICTSLVRLAEGCPLGRSRWDTLWNWEGVTPTLTGLIQHRNSKFQPHCWPLYSVSFGVWNLALDHACFWSHI